MVLMVTHKGLKCLLLPYRELWTWERKRSSNQKLLFISPDPQWKYVLYQMYHTNYHPNEILFLSYYWNKSTNYGKMYLIFCRSEQWDKSFACSHIQRYSDPIWQPDASQSPTGIVDLPPIINYKTEGKLDSHSLFEENINININSNL